MIKKIRSKNFATCISCRCDIEIDQYGDYDCTCGHIGNLCEDEDIINQTFEVLGRTHCPKCMEFSLDPAGFINGYVSCYRCGFEGQIDLPPRGLQMEEFCDIECSNCGMLIRDCKLTNERLYSCPFCDYNGDLHQETLDSDVDCIDDEAFDKYD